jgi:primosomal protein N' (replication factor Y)
MQILQVVINRPFFQTFDYKIPAELENYPFVIGMRLSLPFGTRKIVGFLINLADYTNIAEHKLKTILEILDDKPILTLNELNLIKWASNYYHYPLGQVIATALPNLLLQNKKIDLVKIEKYKEKLLKLNSSKNIKNTYKLNSAQQSAYDKIKPNLNKFQVYLLNGITGSGKTEVYIRVIQQVIQQNLQALILVPEINLTPQMIARFHQRFNVPVVVLHSKINNYERLAAWLLAKENRVKIIIGTRSAAWIPLTKVGVLIVDEEHDSSYKQQSNLRYSARNLMIVRAKTANIPIILGSATPSLESLFNVQQQRYQQLILPERAGNANYPSLHLVDMRKFKKIAENNFSPVLIKNIKKCLLENKQILIFINRRGYASAFMCYACGWIATCKYCNANLTYHDYSKRLHCHHCNARQYLPIICPKCQAKDLHFIGYGTEKITEQLNEYFPDANILRIDSDTTSNKNTMQKFLHKIQNNEIDILVGTQMLAKGHHFPNVTLVGILNIDSNLFSIDFRANEQIAQLLTQVAGRAGRADNIGKVIIQTFHPENQLLNILLKHDYNKFAQTALLERQQANMPPYTFLALLRAKAKKMPISMQFLEDIKQQAISFNTDNYVQILGPVVAPLEYKAGLHRVQLLLIAEKRSYLHNLISKLKINNNKIKYSIDIDPQNLY